MENIITIGVYGGCVQWVTGVPQGVEVRVNDYDIDNADSGIVSSDGNGNSCVVVIYRNTQRPTEGLT